MTHGLAAAPRKAPGNNPSIQQIPQQQPETDQLPTGVPGLQNPMTVPPTVPYAPPQRSAPSNDGTELLRTNSQNPLQIQQTPSGSTLGGSSIFGQSSDGVQDGTQSQRRSMGSMQSQSQGTGGIELQDLSMNSDFAGEGLEPGHVR